MRKSFYFQISYLLKSLVTNSFFFFFVVLFLHLNSSRKLFAGVIYWQAENGYLQTVLRRGSAPFESYYLPVSGKLTSNIADFPLEPILTNTSYGEEPDKTWTYFVLDIPRGAAGGNVRIRLSSDTKITSEIYARFGGCPSLDSWDYYYANKTRNSDGSMFFKLYNSSEEKLDFYLLSIREGTWGFGLRQRNDTKIASKDRTTMSISLDRCPKRCSSHGECKFSLDASGLALYRLFIQLYSTTFSCLLCYISYFLNISSFFF